MIDNRYCLDKYEEKKQQIIKKQLVKLRQDLMAFVPSHNTHTQHKYSRSEIWRDSWCFLNYIFDLSVDNCYFMRQHASLLSDRHPLIYWSIDPNLDAMDNPESTAYINFTTDLPEKYWISEWENPLLPKQHGYYLNNKLINRDIVRYQSTISNFVTSGLLEYYSNLSKARSVVIVEIGGGYGGMAYQLRQYIENTSYILIDLPESLYMAGCFLTMTHPDLSIAVLTQELLDRDKDILSLLDQYDILLIPESLAQHATEIENDLFINMLSFQEMTEKTVREYAKFGSNSCKGYLYNVNSTKHQCNNELISVEEILAEYFTLFPPLKTYESSELRDLFLTHNSQRSKVFIGKSKKHDAVPIPGGYIKVGDGSDLINL